MRLLIIAILVAVGGSSILAFQMLSKQEADRRVRENALETSNILTRYFSESQRFLQGQVHLVANSPAIKNTAYTENVKTVEDRLEFYTTESTIEAMAFLDLDGSYFGVAPQWPKEMGSLKGHPLLASGLKGEDWSGVIAREGKLVMLVATPVSSPGGTELLGVLVGVRTISNDIAKTLRFADDSEVAFLKGDQVLASSRPFDGPFGVSSGPQRLLSKNKEFLGLYDKLPGADSQQQLGFVALRDYDRMIGPYRDMFMLFLLILVGAMVVGLIIGDRFAKGLVKPLDDVVKAAIAMRKGDTPIPFEIGKRRDEVAVLQMVFNDMVTAVEENHKLLLGMIDTDPLTGLLNHRSFQERMRSEVATAKEAGLPLALVLVDLDHFHDHNVTHGHAAGDEQLKGYASLIRAAAPGVAILARYSGDQFAVLLPRYTVSDAEEVAKTIKKAASVSKELITTSIGVSELDPKVPNDEALILSTELGLSRAKQLGRNRISRFESDLSAETPGNSQLLQQYLADGSLATVQALAAAVDAKDQYTKGHSERVADFVRDLAEFTNCSPGFVELVYRAGTLHDVGKIGVPDAILSKNDALTEEERNVMETHPVLGELIVGKVPQLAVLLPGVRSHHERWDGKGYPDGLQGEQIPMMARYLAVADTFDAMTSNRPYRKALPIDVALAEIEKNAGKQFQPDIARAFVRMVRETATQYA
ncbi:MAG: HD domain-containing phosphohydrolase [Fimbriimonas sp.]